MVVVSLPVPVLWHDRCGTCQTRHRSRSLLGCLDGNQAYLMTNFLQDSGFLIRMSRYAMLDALTERVKILNYLLFLLMGFFLLPFCCLGFEARLTVVFAILDLLLDFNKTKN